MTPPPFAQLYMLTTGAWLAQAISVAADLGVADVLRDGPQPCDHIARLVDADADTLYRLLRALSDAGVFAEQPNRHFALTPIGDALRADARNSMRSWARMIGSPFYRAAWSDLRQALESGEPSFARVHGSDLFTYLAAHPDDAEVFDSAMRDIASNFLTSVIGAYDFSGYHHIVDVGGGTGGLLSAVLKAVPSARGTVVEIGQVVDHAAEHLRSAGVGDRAEAVAADFFDRVPGGGDLYILSNIIHDWDDEHAVRVLSTCRAAMATDSRLLAVELVLPDDDQPSIGKLLDLEMLSITPSGRQRTISEHARLFEAAGLELTRAVPAVPAEIASFVEARPATRTHQAGS